MANARAQAAAEHARANAENRCERLEEGFVRERDRAAVAELVLADWRAQLREEQAMVSEFQDTALGMQAQLMSLLSSTRRASNVSSTGSALM